MLAVANPLSQEHSHLRTLLLPSLLEALARNAAWGRDDLALFEIAHTYHPVEGEQLPREPWTFGAVMRGRLGGAAWRRAGEPASFFLGKGVLESILGAVGVTCRVEAMAGGHDPFLHPGRKGFVQVPGEQALGFVGELHPLTARRYGFDDPVVCIELDLDRLCERLGEPAARAAALGVPAPAPGHRGRRRRRAPRQRRAGGGARRGRRAAQRRRRSSTSGATPRRSAPGRRSLALRLTFQAQDRTLSDEEVRPFREAIVERLREAVGAELRSLGPGVQRVDDAGRDDRLVADHGACGSSGVGRVGPRRASSRLPSRRPVSGSRMISLARRVAAVDRERRSRPSERVLRRPDELDPGERREHLVEGRRLRARERRKAQDFLDHLELLVGERVLGALGGAGDERYERARVGRDLRAPSAPRVLPSPTKRSWLLRIDRRSPGRSRARRRLPSGRARRH